MLEENSEVIPNLSLIRVGDGEGSDGVLKNNDVLKQRSLVVVIEDVDFQELA